MIPKPPDRAGDEVTLPKLKPPVTLVVEVPKPIGAKVDVTFPNTEELPNPDGAEIPKTGAAALLEPEEAGIVNEKDDALPDPDDNEVPNADVCVLLPNPEATGELKASSVELPNPDDTTELEGAGWDEAVPNSEVLDEPEDPNTGSALKLNILLLPPPVAKPDFPMLDVWCDPNPSEVVVWLDAFINSATSDALAEGGWVFSSSILLFH